MNELYQGVGALLFKTKNPKKISNTLPSSTHSAFLYKQPLTRSATNPHTASIHYQPFIVRIEDFYQVQ